MKPFTLVNLVLFQAAWFSAALTGQYASMILLLLLGLHFFMTPDRYADLRLLPLAFIGWGIDVVLQQLDVVGLRQAIPLWLLLLWMHLLISFNHSLAWLHRLSMPLQSLLGALSGSSSYLAATKLGAISTQLETWQFLAIYICVWAIILPLLLYLTGKTRRYSLRLTPRTQAND